MKANANPDIILHILPVGEMSANCYVAGCPKTRKAVIIDPGGDAARIKRLIEKEKLTPLYIINTHGHIDHIADNHEFGLPILIHRDDAEFLTDPDKNLSGFLALPYTSPPAIRLLSDKDKIEVGTLTFEVIHTPGHTPGGICLKWNNILFTGDTIFAGGIGRTDFPNGSEKTLLSSIREKLITLDEDIVIYPGHGPSSTIKIEKDTNPFL